jgi:hypothetical protein
MQYKNVNVEVLMLLRNSGRIIDSRSGCKRCENGIKRVSSMAENCRMERSHIGNLVRPKLDEYKQSSDFRNICSIFSKNDDDLERIGNNFICSGFS